MKRIITILALILSFKSSFSQKKEIPPEVIIKAEFYLKEAVGENLFKYFEIAPWYIEYYQHKTKPRKRKIKKNYTGKKKNYKNIKKVNFHLKHPDFQYDNIYKYSTVILDFDLNLVEKIDIDYIPKFILENKQSNWLNEKKIDSIAESKKTKKGIKPIRKTLVFDKKLKRYYWKVINQLNEKLNFRCDVEVIDINPITGIVLKQYETEYRIFKEFL